MTVEILEREVDKMGLRIDRDRVRMRHVDSALKEQVLFILLKDSHLP